MLASKLSFLLNNECICSNMVGVIGSTRLGVCGFILATPLITNDIWKLLNLGQLCPVYKCNNFTPFR